MIKELLKRIKLVSCLTRTCCDKSDNKIMKYLNVAEKNDAAKNIATILSNGNSRRREGISTYNKIYEFDCMVRGQQASMVMTSVSGHLLNYDFVSAFKGWETCSPLTLFDAPVIKTCPLDYDKIKRTLEREIKYCNGLIIWTDCDREGENIGFEIIKVCKDVKPNIQIYRAKFSEITRQSIMHALNNLGQPNKNVSDAVDVRQEIDLRTGAAFTRLQTLRFRKVFPRKLGDKLISYGSCQFPTLGFVVERYQAIENFIPEPFWKIKMAHHIEDLKIDFLWQRERLFDKSACQAILDICQENPTATVEQIESKPKSKWRPLPLDTIEMEKNISRKLRINAKETMKIAERLYTQGLISYPRTETNIFPKNLNLRPLVEQQTNDNGWGAFAQRILNDGGPNPRRGRKSDEAHPPIHPIKYESNLSGNEKKVYEYIVRHFLASVSKDAVGHETIVHTDVANEKFIAKGLMILERNYLDVYIYENWNAKEIYYYHEGDTFTPTVLDMAEGSTSPPKLLTEAELIAIMERHGIGTDATHAEHIETIKSREYVGLQENLYFVPGTLGMGLVEGYNNIELEVSLAKPNLRADFENDLKLICEGRKQADVVKREQVAKYKEVFKKVLDKLSELDNSLANRLQDRPEPVPVGVANLGNEYKPVFKCGKCGNDMVLREKKNNLGKYLACITYPSCKNAVWFDSNVENVDVTDRTCPTCGPDVRLLKIKFRMNPFYGDPNPNDICIYGCDDNVLQTLSINSNRRSTSLNRTNSIAPTNSVAPRTNTSDRNNSSSSATRRDTNPFTLALPVPRASSSLPNSTNNSVTNNGSSSTGNNNYVVCSCNQPAITLTVRKDGPNKGRNFYKCPNGNCDFFLWNADDNQPSTSNTRVTNTSDLKCNCNQTASLKTVQKDGPNKGRQFYCCPKPMGQGCNFFQWADDVSTNAYSNNDDDDNDGSSNGRGGTRTNSRGTTRRGRARTTSSQSTRKRKCGNCGQEGHNRKNCPN